MVLESGDEVRPDFFVSYTAADQRWADWIAWTLESGGFSVVIQSWDFGAGSHFVGEMHRALGNAGQIVAVMSQDYLSSTHATEEWQAAWAADPSGEQRKLLLVRVEDCDRPGLLRQVVSVDIFGIDEKSAKEVVLGLARGSDGRARANPRRPPDFPPSREEISKVAFPGLPGKSRNGRDPEADLNIRISRARDNLLSITYELLDEEPIRTLIPYADVLQVQMALRTGLDRLGLRYGRNSVALFGNRAKLFSKKFLPDDIISLFRQGKIGRLKIFAEPSTPQMSWELAHDGNNFIALETSVLHVVEGGKSPVSHGPARSVLNIITFPEMFGADPTYFLPESDLTVSRKKIWTRTVRAPDRVSLLEAISGTPCDLLYLTCHTGGPGDGDVLLGVGRDAVSLKELIAPMALHPPRVVVLSACDTAASGRASEYSTGGAYGISRALTESHVIGICGSILDETAARFDELFCKYYLESGEVEKTVIKVRRDLAAGGHEGWWRYSVFGPA